MTTSSNEDQQARLREQITFRIEQMKELKAPSKGCIDEIMQLFYKAKQANTKRILDKVEKEIIGENEEETTLDKTDSPYRFNSNRRRRNILRAGMRIDLAQIRNEELGSYTKPREEK